MWVSPALARLLGRVWELPPRGKAGAAMCPLWMGLVLCVHPFDGGWAFELPQFGAVINKAGHSCMFLVDMCPHFCGVYTYGIYIPIYLYIYLYTYGI